jgi:RNA polymerase sigma-70 factor (ECF subfamily)
MPDTSTSLLDRIRLHPDGPSWKRLVDLYTPLIQGWLRRFGGAVQSHDLDDLVQDVVGQVVRGLPTFQHSGRPGAFRCWLRTIAVHRLLAFRRAQKSRPVASGDSSIDEQLAQLEDPESDLSRRWDQEHDRHVLRRLRDLIESEFSTSSWQAFTRTALKGERTAAVAADLGMTVNAVLLAKSRVLRRLRQESRGLIE